LLAEYQRRQKIRGSLTEFARLAFPDNVIQPHHALLIKKLEDIATGKAEKRRLIVCMPPGSAKSTYISKLFPPWFLAQGDNKIILATSYSYSLIEGFGRAARNLIEQHSTELGYSLRKDSKAAGEWETTNGGRYFCAGVNAGIAGHRADIAFIDDPIGSDADARSQVYRDNQWKWYWDDFVPRLRPNGAIIIVANRRHEDDLVGRLLQNGADDWDVVKMPLIIETEVQEKEDRLGRKVGEVLWPAFFTPQKLKEARMSESFSGLYQQDPTPEDGDYFKKEWFEPASYASYDDLPKELRNYVASDHALTTREENDCHCLLPFGVDENDDIWIYPDIWWKRGDTLELVDAMFDIVTRRKPIEWFAESEHIHKSIEPFINKRMRETGTYWTLTGINSTRDLQTRAQSLRGRAKMLKLHLPRFAHWYPRALHELMTFPVGKHDDFVAALAKIGQGLDQYTRVTKASKVNETEHKKPWRPTIAWLKQQDKLANAVNTSKYGGR